MPEVRISGCFSEYVECVLELSDDELREWEQEGGDVGYERAKQALEKGRGCEVARSSYGVDDVEWEVVKEAG